MGEFTASEKALLKSSRKGLTCIGLNHYGTHLVDVDGLNAPGQNAKMFDNKVPLSYAFQKKGIPTSESGWLNMAPWGLRKLLNWVSSTYKPGLPIYVTENGCSDAANRGTQGHYDPMRVMFYHGYLSEEIKAIKEDKVDVRGYYAWSLYDNYEWEMGYREMFGLIFNDIVYLRTDEELAEYNKNTRSPKLGEEHPLLLFKENNDHEMSIGKQVVNPKVKLPSETGERIAKRSFLFLKDSVFGNNRTLKDPAKYCELTHLADHPSEDIVYEAAIKKARTS